MRVIIPDYNPIQAMKFLCAKAFTNKSKSSTFRFFETVDGYNWVTDEWLLAEANNTERKSLKYSPIVDRNPLAGPVIIETLSEFTTSNHVNTLKDLTFDNIYHEHYNYWSLTSLINFFKQFKVKIFKAEKINTHGGSIRIYIKKDKNVKIDEKVINWMRKSFANKNVDMKVKSEKEIICILLDIILY